MNSNIQVKQEYNVEAMLNRFYFIIILALLTTVDVLVIIAWGFSAPIMAFIFCGIVADAIFVTMLMGRN